MLQDEIRRQLRELNTIFKETDAIYSEFAKHSGLSDSAFWIMYSICESDGKCTQKDLCDQWILSKQTVNSALKGLEKIGLITLASSETDKRSKYITLSDKGVKFAREHIDVVFELEEITLQKLSSLDRTALIEINRKYQRLLQEETKSFLKK